jgi:hypothetical protein
MQPRWIQASIVALAAFLGTASRVSADSVTMTFTGTTTNSSVSISLTSPATSGSVTPGPYYWQTAAPPNGPGGPIATFCVEVTQGIAGYNSSTKAYGPALYTATVVNSAVTSATAPTIASDGTTALNSTQIGQKVNEITALYGKYYNSAWGTASGANGDANATAFQLALWELIYDSAYDTSHTVTGSQTYFSGSTGATFTSSSAGTAAQNMVAFALGYANNATGASNLYNNSTSLKNTQLVDLTSSTGQDQLWVESIPPKVTGVPAPPAVLLAGFGILALAGRGRWNRQVPNPA